jgi:hypothetical protein
MLAEKNMKGNQLPILYKVTPSHLPRNRAEMADALTSEMKQALVPLIELSPDAEATEVFLLVKQVLKTMPITVTPAHIEEDKRIIGERYEEYEEYDRFFGIIRVAGLPLSVLLCTTLQGYNAFLEEYLTTKTTVEVNEWGNLRLVFDVTLRSLCQQALFPLSVASSQLCPCGHAEVHPLRRWRITQHIFLTLIQNMIVAMNCFGDAIRKGDLQAARREMQLATTQMLGAASALHIAKDLQPETYEDLVRPSMMPPHVEAGFSGLQSIDHWYFVKQLQALKPVFANLDVSIQEQLRHFLQAFDRVYQAHIFVCARFKGNVVPSMRMNANTKLAGTETLERLRKARLKSIRPEV